MRKSSQKSKQSPFLCLQFRSDSCLHPVYKLYACQGAQYSCVLSQACGWVSKLQVSRINTDPLGEGLAMLLLFAVLSQKSSRTTRQQFRVYGKCSKKPAPRFEALSQCLYSYARKQGSTTSFVPGQAVPPLPNALQERELFLPVRPRGSSDHAAHSRVSVLLPYRSTTMSARHEQGDGKAF